MATAVTATPAAVNRNGESVEVKEEEAAVRYGILISAIVLRSGFN